MYACYLYGLTLPPDRTVISRTRLSFVITIQIFVQMMECKRQSLSTLNTRCDKSFRTRTLAPCSLHAVNHRHRRCDGNVQHQQLIVPLEASVSKAARKISSSLRCSFYIPSSGESYRHRIDFFLTDYAIQRRTKLNMVIIRRHIVKKKVDELSCDENDQVGMCKKRTKAASFPKFTSNSKKPFDITYEIFSAREKKPDVRSKSGSGTGSSGAGTGIHRSRQIDRKD
ncbi:hypothetical protein EVAR_83306_1 [Eumeta japonica]|uniref:Uncharacterized protein n=1 Tax=Eumeta variegata TaxID=151549 RepID=A0A4C1VX46_EUMVA|nr:hypothetical protein EVAR_83306_1 [Eumeta japonica]